MLVIPATQAQHEDMSFCTCVVCFTDYAGVILIKIMEVCPSLKSEFLPAHAPVSYGYFILRTEILSSQYPSIDGLSVIADPRGLVPWEPTGSVQRLGTVTKAEAMDGST